MIKAVKIATKWIRFLTTRSIRLTLSEDKNKIAIQQRIPNESRLDWRSTEDSEDVILKVIAIAKEKNRSVDASGNIAFDPDMLEELIKARRGESLAIVEKEKQKFTEIYNEA